MRKRYHKYQQTNVFHQTNGGSLVKKRKSRPKKKTLKFALLSILTVLLLVIGYVAYSSLSAANNVFTGGISFDSLLNKSSLKQTDGVTNILLLGKGGSNHPGGQLTDTIMLVRYRHSDNKIAMISIPRDMYVKIPGNGEAKINQAYTYGFSSKTDPEERGKAGAELSSQVVTNVTGVPVHYYATADFTGFKEIVDTLGGITVDVKKDLYDPEYPDEGFTQSGDYYKTDAFAPLSIKAGIRQMDGELALKYARSRHGTGVSDFDRAYRQQQVLHAIADKSLSLGFLANPKKISDLASSVGDHVRLSMSVSELRDFIDAVSKVDDDSLINEVIDNSEDGLLMSSNNGSSILLPRGGDFSQIQAFVKNIFSSTAFKSVTVDVLNGSGVVGQAATLAATLEDAGFTIGEIDNNDEEVEYTVVRDGTDGGEAMQKIGDYIETYKAEELDQKGRIVIVIGQDYGN